MWIRSAPGGSAAFARLESSVNIFRCVGSVRFARWDKCVQAFIPGALCPTAQLVQRLSDGGPVQPPLCFVSMCVGMPGPPQKHLDRKLLRARGISEDSRDHATHALVLSVGQAVPIDVGGRVTGRVGPFSLGTLNLESSDPALKNGGERYTSASASFAKSHTLSNRRI